MKKCLCAVLCLVFLTSCSNDEHVSVQIAEKYRNIADVLMEGTVKAVFSDRCDTYRLLYTHKSGENAKIVVVEPVTIAGIEAHISEDGATLRFEDTVLETGEESIDSVSPINAFHKLLQVWRKQGNAQIGKEGKRILLISSEGDYEYRTEFSNDLIPVRAEIFNDSKLFIEIEFLRCEGIK